MSFKLSNTTYSPLFGFPQEQPVDTSPPSLDELTTESIQAYLTEVQANSNKDFGVTTYDHGYRFIGSYAGGVYVPTSDRIYLVPLSQGIQPVWHYINCKTGRVVEYDNGLGTPSGSALSTVAAGGLVGNTVIVVSPVTLVKDTLLLIDGIVYRVNVDVTSSTTIPVTTTSLITVIDLYGGDANALDGVEVFTYTTEVSVGNPYYGGVYCPSKRLIYFVPGGQSLQVNWHYIDTNTDTVVSYSNTVIAEMESLGLNYVGGSYDPDNGRVYFSPFRQIYSFPTVTKLHYIQCDTGSIVSYDMPSSLLGGTFGFAYLGAVYSPSQKRIYFIPYFNANQSRWHYIDTTTSEIVTYSHGFGTTIPFASFNSAVFSPQEDRIYFVPTSSATSQYYIDCSTPTDQLPLVVAYSNEISIDYFGGVYNPTLNRIFFVPSASIDDDVWHYIDCDTGTIVPYENQQGVTDTSTGCFGGVYSPSDNTIYLVRGNTSVSSAFYKIVDFNTPINKDVMAYASFNKL